MVIQAAAVVMPAMRHAEAGSNPTTVANQRVLQRQRDSGQYW